MDLPDAGGSPPVFARPVFTREAQHLRNDGSSGAPDLVNGCFWAPMFSCGEVFGPIQAASGWHHQSHLSLSSSRVQLFRASLASRIEPISGCTPRHSAVAVSLPLSRRPSSFLAR